MIILRQSLFSSDEKDDKKKDRKKYENDSHRGYGRAILLGGSGGAAGRLLGKRDVERALLEGEDLETAKKRGERRGMYVGAVGSALTHAAAGARYDGVPGAIGGAVGGAFRGGLGGYLGVKRSNKEWRRKHEDDD